MTPSNDAETVVGDGFTIRPARPGDLPAIVRLRDSLNALERAGCPHAPQQRLTLDAFTARWGGTLPDPRYGWRVAEADGAAVGFGLIYLLPDVTPPAAFLHWAYLEPAHRGHGKGRRLFAELAGWARGQGAGRIELQFIDGNDTAAAFWTRLGFRPYARRCVVDL